MDAWKKRKLKEAQHKHAWELYLQGIHAFSRFHYLHVFLLYFLRLFGLYRRGVRNALEIQVNEYTIKLARLPRQFDGYRIIHISDLHIGCIPWLADLVCRRLEHVTADICVFTGDYGFTFHDPPEKIIEAMGKIVSSIDVPDGILGILGNHDYGDILPAFKQLGIRMLMNESFTLRRGSDHIRLIGLDDCHYFESHDLTQAMNGVSPQECKVFLIHSPEFIPEAAQADMDLYLCGHCHGGQIRLPGLGAIINNARCKRKYSAGHWRYKDMSGYTHRGTGTSCVPVRFNCPPEIAVHTLRAE